jgi:acyl-coenzyme A synthetase/AMP-(fatty) acid ligase
MSLYKYGMLFTNFVEVSKKYKSKLAINDITYGQLLEIVLNRQYVEVTSATGYEVILDVLKAASINKPIVILPKFRRDEIELPNLDSNQFGIFLFSSGSTGKRKSIFLSEKMILSNAANSITLHQLTDTDKILTVCSLNHTGGLNAQTIAALLSGAHNIVEEFNAFNFFRKLNEHQITVTHLIPVMIDALIKVNNKQIVKSLRTVVAGSDCVLSHHIQFWTDLGVEFISNYGMTEAGPVILNHLYKKGDDLSMHNAGVILGDTWWCDHKIVSGELYLKGNSVNTDDWLPTGDCVLQKEEWIVYLGRKSAGCKIVPKQY